MARTWKPTVAGILSTIAGAISGLAGVVIIARGELIGRMMWHWRVDRVGMIFLALGVVAIIGGIFAIRRRVWGLALAGAICALFPTPSIASILNIVFGILAIIFLALSRNEFSAGAPQTPQPGTSQS